MYDSENLTTVLSDVGHLTISSTMIVICKQSVLNIRNLILEIIQKGNDR
jgi:hypothetical protein